MRQQSIHRLDELIDFLRTVNRRRRKAQALGSAWDRREIDRLNMDAMIFQEHVAQLLGMHRITDNYRDNVAAVIDDGRPNALRRVFRILACN